MDSRRAPASIQSLLETDLPKENAWISQGVLPKGGTLLFGGVAKLGKSFLMLELARALATGSAPLGHPGLKALAPCRVLYIEQEVGLAGLQDRCRLMLTGEDVLDWGPNLWYVSKVPEMQLNRPEGLRILNDFCEQVQPNVLMLDPIGRMQSYDENRSDQIQELFTDLEKILKKHQSSGLSLVLSHHYNKPNRDPRSGYDPLDPYNFRGSSKWFDCPDTLITGQRLQNLPRPYEAWTVKLRFTCRQDSPPKEGFFTINDRDDRKVRFTRLAGEKAEGPPSLALKSMFTESVQ